MRLVWVGFLSVGLMVADRPHFAATAFAASGGQATATVRVTVTVRPVIRMFPLVALAPSLLASHIPAQSIALPDAPFQVRLSEVVETSAPADPESASVDEQNGRRHRVLTIVY